MPDRYMGIVIDSGALSPVVQLGRRVCRSRACRVPPWSLSLTGGDRVGIARSIGQHTAR